MNDSFHTRAVGIRFLEVECKQAESLSEYLKASREKQGLTVGDACYALEVSASQLQVWEDRPQNVPLKTLVAIFDLYGGSPLVLTQQLLGNDFLGKGQ
jgi:hypothetical protein